MVDDQANNAAEEQEQADDLGGTQGGFAFAANAVCTQAIDTQPFNPEAPKAIPDGIQKRHVAGAQAITQATFDQHEDAKAADIPDRFVEEGGVEQGVCWILDHVVEGGQAMLWIDANPKPQGCRAAIGFLVEEVAPAPDGLGDQKQWQEDIQPFDEWQTIAAGVDQGGNQATDQRPMDGQAAIGWVDCEQQRFIGIDALFGPWLLL